MVGQIAEEIVCSQCVVKVGVRNLFRRDNRKSRRDNQIRQWTKDDAVRLPVGTNGRPYDVTVFDYPARSSRCFRKSEGFDLVNPSGGNRGNVDIVDVFRFLTLLYARRVDVSNIS